MSSENSEVFTKENLDRYLNELSKEYKRLGGRRTPVDIVLIGGAAVIERYGFREMTTDVDAIVPTASIMKEAVGRVAHKFRASGGLAQRGFQKDGFLFALSSSVFHLLPHIQSGFERAYGNG